MKKSLLALILCLCLVFSAACAGEDSTKDKDDDNNRKSEETEVTEKETEETEKETEAVVETTENAPVSGEISIDEQIIVDKDGVVITVMSYENDEFYGPTIVTQIENNTEQDLSMSIYSAIVNGIAIDGSLYCDVAAGKKANTEICLDPADLAVSGITTIKDIELIFEGYDSVTYDTLFMSDSAAFSTSADASFVQMIDDSGSVVYDDNGIRIIMKETVEVDEFGDTYFVFYVENNLDVEIAVFSENVSVNGIMIDPVYGSIVPAGKVDFEDMCFWASDLEDNGITGIEEIEFSLYAYDWDSLDDIFSTDVISFTITK